jgi:GNAT superfamily N-acetyltransferase
MNHHSLLRIRIKLANIPGDYDTAFASRRETGQLPKKSPFPSPADFEMTIYATARSSLAAFAPQIPTLLAGLSPTRAQIIAEQIRRLVSRGQQSRLIILTTSDVDSPARPVAALVAVVPHGEQPCDAATVLHAGTLRPLVQTELLVVIDKLAVEFNRQLRRHQVQFVQWATDADAASQDRVENRATLWCTALGFQPISTLDYLCGPTAGIADNPAPAKHADTTAVSFRRFQWSDRDAYSALIALVNESYIETLDCPELSKFRTTGQVLAGYRASDSFAPQLWFTATDQNGIDVGCAILATHLDQHSTIGSIEIVYMGLVPAARGNGLGRQLLQHVFQVARSVGAKQVLLAVDESNTPAKKIYSRAGLAPVVHEKVWVRAVQPAAISEKFSRHRSPTFTENSSIDHS